MCATRAWLRSLAYPTVVASILVLRCSSTNDDSMAFHGGTGGTSSGGPPSNVDSRADGSAPLDAASLYECQSRPPRDPGGTRTEGSACCIMDTGTCTDPKAISDPVLARAYGHDSCASTLKCVPNSQALADAGAFGVFENCSWQVGSRDLEGRCLPACFVQGHPLAGFLSRGSCRNDLVCAPCFNPVDGQSTGACRVKSGDKPAHEPPARFASCGSPPPGTPSGPPGGLCVPQDLARQVENAAISALSELDCAAGEVCAPALKVNDPNACFAQCESQAADLLGEKYRSGGCVPSYVVALVAAAGVGQLGQGTCADGELCAPCLNPLNGDAPSGACQ